MQRVNLIFRYLSYKLFARHKHGHGIHSPFVYDFIRKVLNQHEEHSSFRTIEKIRYQYLGSNEPLAVAHYGAGSRTSEKHIRKLKQIVRSSAVSAKYGQMLHHTAKYYQPEFIIELGTSAGISTAYLATANPATRVITIEGDSNILQIARKTFHALNLKNIEQLNDTFENALEHILKSVSGKLLVFVDGNHQFSCVLNYFQKLKIYSDECLVIFDDIKWSGGMIKAWEAIRSDTEVNISIDLFFMGIVMLHANIRKQNFVIKF